VNVDNLVRAAGEYEHIKLHFNVVVIVPESNRKNSESKNPDVD
jgi:hypothetical protein